MSGASPGVAAPRTSPVRARRVVASVLAAAWAGLVFWLSSRSQLPFSITLPFGVDKVAHASAYAVLGALLTLATAGARFSGRRAVLIAVALASLYGVADEIHQSFVPGRDTSAGDWAADTAGALAGAAVAALSLRRRPGAA